MEAETTRTNVEERLLQIRVINQKLSQAEETLSLLEHVLASRNVFSTLIFDRIKGPVVIKDVPDQSIRNICESLAAHFSEVKSQLIKEASELIK